MKGAFMTHGMKLTADAFAVMKRGSKTVEMRLYDEKRRKIRKGDVIEFANTQNGDIIRCSVLDTAVYKNFEELYARYDKISLGYGVDDVADPKDMLRYYSQSDIEKYGVTAIKVFLI